MYTLEQQQDIFRAVNDYFVDQLLWRTLYINSEAYNTPEYEIIKEKLNSLANTFELIIKSIMKEPACDEFIDAIKDETNLYIQYVDELLKGGPNVDGIKSIWNKTIQKITNSLSSMYPNISTLEYNAMLSHQQSILSNIASCIKSGKYYEIPDNLTGARKLIGDCAIVLTKTLLSEEK